MSNIYLKVTVQGNWKKRGHFLYHLFCVKETFVTYVFYLNFWCIEFQNIHTLIYQKTLLHTLFGLLLKLLKAFSLSLRSYTLFKMVILSANNACICIRHIYLLFMLPSYTCIHV